MARSLTTRNLLMIKPGAVASFTSEVLRSVIGEADRKGCWIVYGNEKNGKTWATLLIAKDLSIHEKVAYISAEEGFDGSFRQSCLRAGINAQDQILWHPYMTIDEIITTFKKRKTPNIIIIDNLTMYSDEMKPTELKKRLLDELPDKLFILLAHEERREASPALARMAKKMAKVIINVKGLTAHVTSRFSPGGVIVIDEQKSNLVWGEVQTSQYQKL